VIALTDPDPATSATRLTLGINLISLCLLIWGITAEAPPGLGGRHLAAGLLLVAAVAGWLGWVVSRFRPGGRLAPASLLVMGVTGGALVAFAALAMVFVGVAALGATSGWTPRRAAGLALPGPAAMLVAVLADAHGLGIAVGALAATLAGAVMGISRRQAHEQSQQATLMAVTEARADAERARAELLAGRNHLARELHDVLAHTLSALSLQLEALDALMSADPPSPAVRDQLDRTKRLVREGMSEARGAVRALREDVLPLEEQLVRLADERHATMEIGGEPRRLSADVSLALYRVAQEALTNVVKHAPGADAAIELGFGSDCVQLTVSNGPVHPGHPAPLAPYGGGYGLQGLRERVLLLGGQVEAGPVGDGPVGDGPVADGPVEAAPFAGGWRVRAVVPA
jgi:signal transduction histidine kinase